jgi:hypothetical protein
MIDQQDGPKSASRIVLGLGTSHSPLLAFDAPTWASRARDDLKNESLNLSDGRLISYEQLKAERGENYTTQATLQQFEEQIALSQVALDKLADELERAAPDIAIIIGDDHGELFSASNVPGFAIFYGDDILMHPWKNTWKDPPEWFDQAMRAYAMDAPHRFQGASAFARRLIVELMNRNVDVASISKVDDPHVAGLGHAFGFVIRRLFRGRPIPVVPVLLNTYFEPNNVRPARCYDLGRALSESIKSIPGGSKVAVISSGGLSHFVTDEVLDRRVLAGLRERDATTLRTLPLEALKSGSSEILCWVMAAGALEELEMSWSEYTPVFRTPAGSGIGLAFAAWHPAAPGSV